jgi:restriction endonuclease S subunit
MSRYKRYERYKDSGVEWIGEIPEHWNNKKISWIFNIIGSGTTPSTSNLEYYDGDVPWVNTGDLNDGYLYETSKMITDLALKDYSTLKFYPIDTLLIAMYD